MSMTRTVAVSTGTLALVGYLLLGANGAWTTDALQALAHMGGTADYVDNGVRIVPPSATSAPGEETGDDSDGTSKTDIEGDEVSPALATYGIDRDGNLFEVHSPQTEVPRLPGPTI
jgi:hypothetical protein